MLKKITFLALLTIGFLLPPALQAAPHAFPVPFVASRHSEIRFNELPASGRIRIFTLTGEKVAELAIPSGAGIVSWNVRNSEGEDVVTGVYFFEIKGEGQKTTGKIVVIR